MDPSKYKTTITSRGITYSYYFAPPKPSKPAILFCHGFPSTARDWEKEALFFEERGYGIIVPDMLGYGDTSKPTNVDAYIPSLISKDLVELLDAEGIQKAIAIGHDWGAKAVSRLANHHPERFYAYAFLAVPFWAPRPPMDHDEFLKQIKARYGYELFGYWEYYASGEFDGDFRAHSDAVFHIVYPTDPAVWVTHWAPRGALKSTILSDFNTPLPTYRTEEDKKTFIDLFTKNGFDAPTQWYAVMTSKKSAEDDMRTIPENHRFPPVNVPIFFGAARDDGVCTPQLGYDAFAVEEFKHHNVTIREFDGGHWIIFSHADEINKELLSWIEGTVNVKIN
ncbi:alpha/beta-hydrolase [Trametopsis cervina]|nr:alpha/beta-hydrolase [Trametopsis cervina]